MSHENSLVDEIFFTNFLPRIFLMFESKGKIPDFLPRMADRCLKEILVPLETGFMTKTFLIVRFFASDFVIFFKFVPKDFSINLIFLIHSFSSNGSKEDD